MKKKCLNALTVKGSDHLHAPHVKVLGFNLDTLIEGMKWEMSSSFAATRNVLKIYASKFYA